jgi:hypothetical protein
VVSEYYDTDAWVPFEWNRLAGSGPVHYEDNLAKPIDVLNG